MQLPWNKHRNDDSIMTDVKNPRIGGLSIHFLQRQSTAILFQILHFNLAVTVVTAKVVTAVIVVVTAVSVHVIVVVVVIGQVIRKGVVVRVGRVLIGHGAVLAPRGVEAVVHAKTSSPTTALSPTTTTAAPPK